VRLLHCALSWSLTTFALVAAATAAPFNIQGIDYSNSTPTEVVTASFLQSDGGVTANNYYGFVRLVVQGTGQSLGTDYNDAFYIFANAAGAPIGPSNDASYYQLAVDTAALVGSQGSPTPTNRAARNFIHYDVTTDTEVSPVYVPAYNANHVYEFIIDVESLISWGGSASPLHFGVIDGNFNDNSGSYQIEVTQLTPSEVPEPGTLSLAALGAGVMLLRVRRRYSSPVSRR